MYLLNTFPSLPNTYSSSHLLLLLLLLLLFFPSVSPRTNITIRTLELHNPEAIMELEFHSHVDPLIMKCWANFLVHSSSIRCWTVVGEFNINWWVNRCASGQHKWHGVERGDDENGVPECDGGCGWMERGTFLHLKTVNICLAFVPHPHLFTRPSRLMYLWWRAFPFSLTPSSSSSIATLLWYVDHPGKEWVVHCVHKWMSSR